MISYNDTLSRNLVTQKLIAGNPIPIVLRIMIVNQDVLVVYKTIEQKKQNNNSYSEILKTDHKNSFEKLEYLIQNQIELTHKLLNMMTVSIVKLCN